ncbi:MAG: Dps family protein [Bacilli bacterium]
MNREQLLNKQLANWSVLFFKLHQYHWFVKGENFFELHEKFEAYYDEAKGYIDEIAERILMNGDQPTSTMESFIRNASLKEGDVPEDARDMVENVLSDFETIIEESNEAIEALEEMGQRSSADLLIDIVAALEKHCWMLRTYLA